jgi:DNA adenine methylase
MLNLLRYPGGKKWLYPKIRPIIPNQRFVELFAGGATIGLSALSEGLIPSLWINELDYDVYSMWDCILNDGDNFSKRILSFSPTPKSVRAINKNNDSGFWTLVKNRCSYGGLIHKGSWLNIGDGRGVMSRWNGEKLSKVVLKIFSMREKISLTNGKGEEILQSVNDSSMVYVDPPYINQGEKLYRHGKLDHQFLMDSLSKRKGNWIASYDNAPESFSFAQKHNYKIVSSRNTGHQKRDELLISNMVIQ